MKPLGYISHCLIVVFILLQGLVYVAECQEVVEGEVAAKALSYFEDNNFGSAVSLYEKLHEEFTFNEVYSYYLGRCYFDLNVRGLEAVDLLNFAVTKKHSADANYYLAKAYYYTYQFDNARQSLTNFNKLASKKAKRQMNTEGFMNAIENARKYVTQAQDFKFVEKTTILDSSFESNKLYSANKDGYVRMSNYSILKNRVVADDFGSVSRKKGLNTTVYFSASKKRKTKQGDLFAAHINVEKDLVNMHSLKELNTSYDERHPYYDELSGTLYFSSNRLEGLGGYDIYKSKFNKQTNSFSKPELLSFPFNSPLNDYIVSFKNGELQFASNRNNALDSITIYKVKTTGEIRLLDTERHGFVRKIAGIVEVNEQSSTVGGEMQNKKSGLSQSNDYTQLVRLGMAEQLLCDSLKHDIVEHKNKLRKEKDESERKKLFSLLAKDERQLKAHQSNADKYFNKAETLRVQPKVEIAKKITPTSNVKNEMVYLEKQIGGMKVYSYKTTKDKTIERPAPQDGAIDISANANFNILSQSPYSSKNPIPTKANLPLGLVYRIQLGVFGQNVAQNAFGGLMPLTAEKIENKELTRFYVGYFASSKEAKIALEKVKQIGYADAFLVCYNQTKRIAIQKAREIEFSEK